MTRNPILPLCWQLLGFTWRSFRKEILHKTTIFLGWDCYRRKTVVCFTSTSRKSWSFLHVAEKVSEVPNSKYQSLFFVLKKTRQQELQRDHKKEETRVFSPTSKSEACAVIAASVFSPHVLALWKSTVTKLLCKSCVCVLSRLAMVTIMRLWISKWCVMCSLIAWCGLSGH